MRGRAILHRRCSLVPLWLIGRWGRDEVVRDLDLTTPFNSVRVPLKPLGSGPDSVLTLTHQPARRFDGIELAEEDEARILRAVLTNFISHTTTLLTLCGLAAQ